MLQKRSYQAVNSVNLDINKGEIYGIIGESGAGKSTLLRLMNALESPDHGSVIVNGQDLTLLSEAKLREARRSIGVIFQHFNLLQNRTVLGNVTVPLELTGVPHKARRERALQCLNFVGLTEYVDQYPAQLSGGQKQRVAIARALANQPHVLLCDEPTSSLDPKTTAEILEVLRHVNEVFGVTIVIVTHEMEVVRSICHTVAVMEQGSVVDRFALNDRDKKNVIPPRLTFREQLLGKDSDSND